jgi:PadR family transcriptional regulator PadR
MARRTRPGGDMLQGTLDLLILQSLAFGPAHGHTIAHAIERGSDHVLEVEHGSLYPALHRLEERGWVAAFWGTSENNRKAKYYRLSPQAVNNSPPKPVAGNSWSKRLDKSSDPQPIEHGLETLLPPLASRRRLRA